MAAALSKAELRQRFRALRRSRGPAVQARIASRLGEVVEALLPREGRLGLYWPLASEIDLRSAAQDGGWPLALPVVEPPRPGQDRPAALRYRCWRPGMALVPDHCGIPSPADGSEALSAAQLGLLLIPALAFDHRGIRLGSGGGWYDRLRSDPAWRDVTAIAVLPAACVLEALPADPWDQPLDGWLDEDGLHLLGGAAKVASS